MKNTKRMNHSLTTLDSKMNHFIQFFHINGRTMVRVQPFVLLTIGLFKSFLFSLFIDEWSDQMETTSAGLNLKARLQCLISYQDILARNYLLTQRNCDQGLLSFVFIRSNMGSIKNFMLFSNFTMNFDENISNFERRQIKWIGRWKNIELNWRVKIKKFNHKGKTIVWTCCKRRMQICRRFQCSNSTFNTRK